MKNLKKICEYFAVAFPIVLVCGFIGLVIEEVQSRENNIMLFLTKPLKKKKKKKKNITTSIFTALISFSFSFLGGC